MSRLTRLMGQAAIAGPVPTPWTMPDSISATLDVREDDIRQLVHRRTELRGKITRSRRDLQRLAVEFQNIDAAIRELKGNGPAPRVLAPVGSGTSDMKRILFEALDAAATPMTSHDLAVRVMEELGLDATDRGLLKHMVKRVCVCLWEQVQKGHFRQSEPGVRPLKWERLRTAR